MEKRVTYFDQRSKMISEKVFELVRARATELGISQILVPSTGGTTGLLALQKLPEFDVIVVTHSTGFTQPGHQEVPLAAIDEMKAKGAKVLTGTHAFGGIGRAVRKKFSTYQTEEIIAQTLRCFGEGTKVAIEISLMAADAGLVSPQREIISCGGTGRGVDAALVLKPAHTQTFFDLEILELICKPRFT